MSVHVPTSCYRRETRLVVLGDEKRQSVFAQCHHANAVFTAGTSERVFL